MAEANRSIPQIHTIHITTVAHTLARLRARRAVKRQLQQRGVKVSHFAAKEITALACEYLAQHRSELMPDAIATITQWTLAGESAYSVQHLRDLHKRKRPDPRALFLCKCHERNGA